MDQIMHRKTKEIVEGALGGGGSGGLFTFAPTGLEASTLSTEEWQILEPTFPDTITVDLKLEDVSGKLFLSEVYATIRTPEDGTIEVTRSLAGNVFYLTLGKYTEAVSLANLFEDWAQDFMRRVKA